MTFFFFFLMFFSIFIVYFYALKIPEKGLFYQKLDKWGQEYQEANLPVIYWLNR